MTQNSDGSMDFPPGFISRKRKGGGNHYYYQTSSAGGKKRREYPLGKNRAIALQKWKEISSEVPPSSRKVTLRPWVAELMHKATRVSARKRGLACELSVEDVRELLSSSKGRCALTGIPFDLFKDPNRRVRLWAPSLDRIDCSQGYVPGNVRVVANAVNIALSDFGEIVLLEIAKGLIKTKYGKII